MKEIEEGAIAVGAKNNNDTLHGGWRAESTFFPFSILNLLKLSFLSSVFFSSSSVLIVSLVSFPALGRFFTRSRDGKQIIAFFVPRQFFNFQFFYNVQTNERGQT